MTEGKTGHDISRRQGISRAAIGGHRWTDSAPRKEMHESTRIVLTSPYAIFVHNSPIYRTCRIEATRLGRPTRRAMPRRKRLLPYRPDGYPFANERWSRRYRRENQEKTADQEENNRL